VTSVALNHNKTICWTQQKLTSADQVPAQPVPEVVKDSVSVFLKTNETSERHKGVTALHFLRSVSSHLHHLGVDVEAGVAQLSDLLGQELHPLSGVTEDDRLVDLKL